MERTRARRGFGPGLALTVVLAVACRSPERTLGSRLVDQTSHRVVWGDFADPTDPVGAYRSILGTLGVGGYRDEALGLAGVDYGGDHFTCFQFDCDWRLDNVMNARQLSAFIEEKRACPSAGG